MAPTRAPKRRSLVDLPDEVLMCIISHLDEKSVAALQSTSTKLKRLGRDGTIWKWRCFEESPFLDMLKYRHVQLEGWHGAGRSHQAAPTDGPAVGGADSGSILHMIYDSVNEFFAGGEKKRKRRLLANWDPTYPGEKVSWYHEYIQRHGPTTTNWFENPVTQLGSVRRLNEVRGLGLYCPTKASYEGASDALFAVSPLDDGSVCLFDVKGTHVKKGSIAAKSKPGLLFEKGFSPKAGKARQRLGHTGMTECVSIDNVGGRAFFAVQGGLAEVDLQTLKLVDFTTFEFSIMTLSAASPRVPLSVGTSKGLHFHDYRAPRRPRDVGSILFSKEPLMPYASSRPPLCIYHVPSDCGGTDVSDSIYVSGRFPSIIRYDRRNWPRVMGTLYSGASSICGITSLPYRYSNVDAQVRKWGKLSHDRVKEIKAESRGGYTIVAGGEYNTKGSLELYGVSGSDYRLPRGSNDESSTLKNRQTVSSAKVLAVLSHGTRVLFSDGNGLLKWFERDGTTEVRRHLIGPSEKIDYAEPTLFVRDREDSELARKILSTQTAGDRDCPNMDDVVFWTGEKLGMVTFSSKPGFTADDFEDKGEKSGADLEAEAQERIHSGMMRRVLEQQANSVRLTRGFGLGGFD